MASLRRRAAFMAAPFLAFAVLLGAAEAFARYALTPVTSLEFFVSAPKQRRAFTDRYQVRIFEGDPVLFWRLMPNLDQVVWDGTLVSTNAQGVRHPRPLGRKAAGVFRILCLGDSVTFGYRVPRVFRRRDSPLSDLSYPRLLENRLREANPRREVEVVALAVPGYSSHQGLAWLRRDIGWLGPDLVTACFGWNDIDRRARTDGEAMPIGWPAVTARRLMSGSQGLMHTALWLRSVRGSSAGSPGASVMRVPREQYVANILEMARLARQHGARAAVIAPIYGNPIPHPPEGEDIGGHRQALDQALGQAGVPYLEVTELTERSYPENAPLFAEHIHPNHRGHRVLAEGLLRFLAAQGLLPGLVAP